MYTQYPSIFDKYYPYCEKSREIFVKNLYFSKNLEIMFFFLQNGAIFSHFDNNKNTFSQNFGKNTHFSPKFSHVFSQCRY